MTYAFSSFLSKGGGHWCFLLTALLLLLRSCHGWASFSSFGGQCLASSAGTKGSCRWTMRKQKASNKRTRRRQLNGYDDSTDTRDPLSSTATAARLASPLPTRWRPKRTTGLEPSTSNKNTESSLQRRGSRQRSRKRSTLYNALAFYHESWTAPLTAEFRHEEACVTRRLEETVDSPVALQDVGHVLLDLVPQFRGTVVGGDHVYRLTRSVDATTQSFSNDEDQHRSLLPAHHKFTVNDMVLITRQEAGCGDYFYLPTTREEIVEARVLGTGPTYVDLSVAPGLMWESPDDRKMHSKSSLVLRVDRFFSPIPYERMVAALGALTSLPDRSQQQSSVALDEVIREAIIQTYAFSAHHSPLLRDPLLCNVQELSTRLSKPPMATSVKLAKQVLTYMISNPQGAFPTFNAPQASAIEAALTRRLTMIHGPPGTGKTTVAGAIGFGFVHQCRSLPGGQAKVLACAFSNVGADNLAEELFFKMKLKVIRIGKPSAVTECLWACTLDAAIDKDPAAQKARDKAAKATALLAESRRRQTKGANKSSSEHVLQQLATEAVKDSIRACNIAATCALREADVIVSTATGAADPRLLGACGVFTKDSDDNNLGKQSNFSSKAELAPDGQPPLSLPFVIVDEACQSVEPATLIPITASNSCRALVMMGDPCQLPPTVMSKHGNMLSLSLMERLAAVIPYSGGSAADNSVPLSTQYMSALPLKQGKSLLDSRQSTGQRKRESYKRAFSGSHMLSIQYRMHPSIAAFSSAIFYNSLLGSPSSLTKQHPFPQVFTHTMPCGEPTFAVRVVDVGGRYCERKGIPATQQSSILLHEGSTYWNEPEAERIVSLVKTAVGDPDKETRTVGVVTPYRGQVQLIKSLLASDDELLDLLRENPVPIEVSSVDGYQGRERDLILFSAVRSNRHHKIGFLNDSRRLNVAMTRAKKGLIIVADLDMLATADPHWDALRKWATGVRCIVDDSDDSQEEASC